ncbi:hypothetical protein GYMLUDRAFT_598560 [Collybiopsis luxurians FD-317 M1]|uniref:DUF6699 domain-containing protein n=1 Tax=Collybiopsis luxurians FD-317 M1 TaxID=944289 RepID=A0A0D0BYP7_9AGAR|nr:hypothetical protein GYMLUDRAFT_598560 [Collybiopsis luxurians FD-317 M1]
MSSSHYSKSAHSARSHGDSEVESWGTVYSGSRTPTPTHSAVPPNAYAHRSNASYPSPHYGPSSSFGGFSPSYSQTPGTPYLGSVSLPQQYCVSPVTPSGPHLLSVPLPAESAINPLLKYPPKAVFNVTYSCSSIAFRDGLTSNDVAVFPPVHSMVIVLSICHAKKFTVTSSSPNGVTVHDILIAISKCMFSAPQPYELSSLHPNIVARGKASQMARRRMNDTTGLRWLDFLGDCVYFGGLVKTPSGSYEVGFVPTPLA